MGGETRMDDYILESAQAVPDAPVESDLLRSCRWLMKQIEDGVLVRNTFRDGGRDFHARAIEFVRGLAEADAAIRRAEGKA